MPVNVLRKDLPRGTSPLQGSDLKKVEEAKHKARPQEEALLDEDLAAKEQEALWDAADDAMTEKDGSLRW